MASPSSSRPRTRPSCSGEHDRGRATRARAMASQAVAAQQPGDVGADLNARANSALRHRLLEQGDVEAGPTQRDGSRVHRYRRRSPGHEAASPFRPSREPSRNLGRRLVSCRRSTPRNVMVGSHEQHVLSVNTFRSGSSSCKTDSGICRRAAASTKTTDRPHGNRSA